MASKNSDPIREHLLQNKVSVGQGGEVYLSYLGESIVVTTLFPFEIEGVGFSITAHYNKGESGEFQRRAQTAFYRPKKKFLPSTFFQHLPESSGNYSRVFQALDSAIEEWALENSILIEQVELMDKMEKLRELETRPALLREKAEEERSRLLAEAEAAEIEVVNLRDEIKQKLEPVDQIKVFSPKPTPEISQDLDLS